MEADETRTPRYELVVAVQLDQRWADWFHGLSLELADDGTTVLRGPVADQAALHGLLAKLRDLGLPLIAVSTITPDAPDRPLAPTAEPHGSPTKGKRHAH